LTERFTSGVEELDRVIGGGFVPGSVILIGGEPGVGKSTLVLQMLSGLSGHKLYVSGEESKAQIRMRADRLGSKLDDLYLLNDTTLSAIQAAATKLSPQIIVVDSIQTLFDESGTGAPGSVSQIRDTVASLLQYAKAGNTTVVLVGHVTKEGQLAGPRLLEHMVDTVLYFEGDANASWRILRATKNRFGATDELGLFEMTERGLMSLSGTDTMLEFDRQTKVSGSAITAAIEGTRPLLLEIQSLLVPSSFPSPLRTTQGIDRMRFSMLLAVLEKKLSLGLLSMDAYCNVTGGIRIGEPSADLAVAASVLSSVRDMPLSHNAVVLGEIGLGGEVRRVSAPERRILEGLRLGFQTFVLPADNESQISSTVRARIENIYFVSHVGEASDVLFSS
jgi:DNA repair protein RadA/Sms